MASENNSFEGQSDISRFLEKFQQENAGGVLSSPEIPFEGKKAVSAAARQEKYEQSFEKLEEKIRELEDKFEASAAQNQAVMHELARTREAVENQKSKDAFFANITTTIAHLKESVENLSRAQQAPRPFGYGAGLSRAFDPAPAAPEYLAMYHYQPENYRAAQQAKLRAEREENEKVQAALQAENLRKEQTISELKAQSQSKDRLLSDLQAQNENKQKTLFDLQALSEEKERALTDLRTESAERARIMTSLQQKTSQLKAVNVALDREIKRVQQERMEALRKSAEQAREILSLRDALTAAEERFKSFDFEGRIISIKRQYQQKVTKLESQLHEISNTCMRQVEEIESLKNENLKLHKIAEEREQLAALYEAKTRQLEALQASVTQLRTENDQKNQARLAAFTHRMQRLQQEHEDLAARLTRAQEALLSVNAEKRTLEDNFKTLLGKIEQNDKVIETLKRKIEVLTAENEQLRGRTAAPKAAPRPQAPAREPATVRQPLAAAAQTPAKTLREPLPAPETAPVEMQNTLRSKVQTEADLPEIRVADPMPQEELYNGEDFLEKTDSFIGRMKWSIFREDK